MADPSGKQAANDVSAKRPRTDTSSASVDDKFNIRDHKSPREKGGVKQACLETNSGVSPQMSS